MVDKVRTLDWQAIRSAHEAGLLVNRIVDHAEITVHDHVFHEIVYVESGSAQHVTVEAPRRLRPGDLIVIRPQVWHGYRQTQRLCIINCLFDKRVVQRLNPWLAHVPGTLELYRQPSRRTRREAPLVLHLRPSQRPALIQALERILVEQRDKSPGWEAAAGAALLDVLVQTARCFAQESPAQQARLSNITDQVVLESVSYLEERYNQPISLTALAQRAGMSAPYLSRCFSRRMGMGVVEFVHLLRCEEACRLLLCSNQSIGRIATVVGYQEIAYFSRCFRRHTGQSPRAYRQRVAAD